MNVRKLQVCGQQIDYSHGTLECDFAMAALHMAIICHGNTILILECCLTTSSDCTPRVLPREGDGEVEVEQQIQRITTFAGIRKWIDAHKPRRCMLGGRWEHATELIGTGQQRQHDLAAKRADEAQKAATPKEVEGKKSCTHGYAKGRAEL